MAKVHDHAYPTEPTSFTAITDENRQNKQQIAQKNQLQNKQHDTNIQIPAYETVTKRNRE
jgi:hypothetical protein